MPHRGMYTNNNSIETNQWQYNEDEYQIESNKQIYEVAIQTVQSV